MAITWKEDADSRAHLGPNVAQQDATASFASSDYATGGYLVNPNFFGMGRIRDLWEVKSTTPPLGVIWKYNGTTKSLQAYWAGSANGFFVEVPASTDLSTSSTTFKAEGF